MQNSLITRTHVNTCAVVTSHRVRFCEVKSEREGCRTKSKSLSKCTSIYVSLYCALPYVSFVCVSLDERVQILLDFLSTSCGFIDLPNKSICHIAATASDGHAAVVLTAGGTVYINIQYVLKLPGRQPSFSGYRSQMWMDPTCQWLIWKVLMIPQNRHLIHIILG